MILAVEPSVRPAAEAKRATRFVLLGGTAALASAVRDLLAKPLGFEPDVVAAASDLASLEGLEGEAFLLPLSLEFGLFEKEALAGAVASLRRTTPGLEVHYDDVRLSHPLLVEAFCDVAFRPGRGPEGQAGRRGVLLVAGGEGDPASRAEIYALMRNVWERLGAARGEVAFLRHATPFVRAELERLAQEPLEWIVIPAMLERGERFAHLEVIVEDQRRNRPEQALLFAEPPAEHPAVTHWVAQRALDLWRSKRQAESLRAPSPKRTECATARRVGQSIETGVVGNARDAAELRALLPEPVLDAETVFVKATWHGYATGTFTDPVALDALLEAVPGRVVLVEGHTSSRNDGARVDWSWEDDAREHRAWIRAQEHAYLEKTGLYEVIRRHKATYINVTEEYWDGHCLADASVFDLDPEFPELAAFVPSVLAENAGAPLISFARFKGPTRLSLSNLFGLIPAPLRARWHGPNASHLARVCCAIAKLYGSMFELYGVVEGLNTAVRWDRRGLYRSRWGNYDLTLRPGLATVSRGVVAADVLAARLQGHDPRKSAYYEAVAATLGLPDVALELELPQEWVRRLS